MSPSPLIFKGWVAPLAILFGCTLSLFIKTSLLSRLGWGNRKRSFWVAFGLQVISGIGGILFLISLGFLFGGGIGAQSSEEFERLLYRFGIPAILSSTILIPYFLYAWILSATLPPQSRSAWKISFILLFLEILVWALLGSILFSVHL
jgi:hypothetical protein